MNRAGVRREIAALSLACLSFALLHPPAMLAQAADDADFVYHTQSGDTLIGLGRRLLLAPQRWREMQTHNRIADANRIPLGAALRIPYAWLRTTTESATVANVAGGAQRAGAAIAPGDTLPAGAVIETGADGSVTLDLADASVVTVQKSSVLKLDEMARVTGVSAAHSIRLELDAGRLETVVKPHRDVGRFEIITPVAVTAVRGTRFRDGFGAGGRSTAETLEGTVGVAGSGDAVTVPAGFGTRVEQGMAPLPPVPLLPPPDLSGLPPTNPTDDLHVDWQPVARARSYRLQVAPDASFHAISADVETAAARADVAHLADGDYWVRARSIDEFGIEGTDAVARFTQHVLPATPVPVAPPVAARLSGARTRFDWQSSGMPSAFTLQISATTDFAAPLIVASRLSATHGEIDAPPPGTYFWRVAGISAQGETGSWSPVRSFVQLPAAPQPNPPQIDAGRVTVRWHTFAVQRYRVEVAREPTFASVRIDRLVDDPQLTLPKSRPGIYYVRLQGILADGSTTPFGPARRFEIPVPRWIRLLLPAIALLSLVP